ncbi:Zn-dependent exopeptidase [Thozetella sp. PMI_491]|nr:Zn-dependent exopeptidase [Thozetella sp. PMI_491]
MNYPTKGGRAVEILDAEDEVIWAAQLEENAVGEKAGRQTYVFHGHSKSGDVKGPLIYVNYGSREDFKVLYDSGIDTKGAVALVRYYGTQGDPALKVKAAQEAGFVGCIVYNDPADNGFVRGPTAPDGRFMPVDGVQRGAVGLGSWVAGDVLTPGWGSKKDAPRLSKDDTPGLVNIPSIPISWRDAEVLLHQLQGIGQRVPDGWTGGVPGGADWFIGNQSSPTIRLKNEQIEEEKQPIWNVYGRIIGTEERDKRIVIGNHRDSWTFGAADPHSGTAILMELARIFGGLLATGWRPRRTLEFMSWDGEEYNLIGSTEYVEQNADILRDQGLAYINLDTVVSGDILHGTGSPMFQKLFLEVIKNVTDPNHNATLRELWDRRVSKFEGLDSGSDYVPFQDMVGISSLDIFFGSKERYPYHSSYDNFEWMDRVGDPGFIYHTLIGQVLSLLVLELVDRPIVPFDIAAYATALSGWVCDLINWSEDKELNQDGNTPLDLNILHDAADEVALAAKEFVKWETRLSNITASEDHGPRGMHKQKVQYNERIAKFESDLLDSQGIPNRTQFKHVIFGPQLWPRENPVYFPSIVDTILAGEWDLANKTVERVAAIIKQAARNLIS